MELFAVCNYLLFARIHANLHILDWCFSTSPPSSRRPSVASPLRSQSRWSRERSRRRYGLGHDGHFDSAGSPGPAHGRGLRMGEQGSNHEVNAPRRGMQRGTSQACALRCLFSKSDLLIFCSSKCLPAHRPASVRPLTGHSAPHRLAGSNFKISLHRLTVPAVTWCRLDRCCYLFVRVHGPPFNTGPTPRPG